MICDIMVNTWRSAIDAVAPRYDEIVRTAGDGFQRPKLENEAEIEDKFTEAYKANNLPAAFMAIEAWRTGGKRVLE